MLESIRRVTVNAFLIKTLNCLIAAKRLFDMIEEKTKVTNDLAANRRLFEHRIQMLPRYVYGIQSGAFIKVGVALNIKKRLNDMRALNPHPVTVVFRRRMYAAYHCERRMHELLQEKAIGREWFEASIEDVRAAGIIGVAHAKTVFQKAIIEEREWRSRAAAEAAVPKKLPPVAVPVIAKKKGPIRRVRLPRRPPGVVALSVGGV